MYDKVEFHKISEDWLIMCIDGNEYELCHDELTGDWAVVEFQSEYPQQQYMYTKSDAIAYVLYIENIMNEKLYRMAPDRC